MKFYSLTAALFIGLCAVNAQAQTLDLNLNEHSVQAAIDSASPWNNTAQQLSFTFTDKARRDEDGYAAAYGLYTGGKDGQLSGRVGGKLLYVDAIRQDGGAVALGGEMRFIFSSKLNLRLMANVAPSVLAFGDVERYREWGAHLMFTLVPNASVYAGYKSTRVDFNDVGKIDLQKGWNLGFEMRL